ASVGVTVFPDDGVDPDTLIKNADIAMYRAKETGKGRCSVFTPAMNERVVKRLKLENELRKAIEAKELLPYYQPLVDVQTGEVTGMEALVRWQKEHGELISPISFLPTAEETGLILQIDEHILRTACAYVKKLNDSRNGNNLYVSVNMSARQLGRRDIVETVISAYTQAGLEPENLGLEVTEGIIIDNFDNAVNILTRIRDLGVRIFLDDFGTGYSSLSYLKKLPLDVLKMDKTFVSDLPEDKNSRAIAHAITSMAHELGIKMVAEGVETEGQLEYLRSIGCDIIQGYIYSKPLPGDKLKNFVSEKKQLGEVTRI
ncbi:diguanylate cyclase/phosphodiesterase (GGDEF & EAL domains) with PAS/PAC sensor(s), partial [hydrothermal vent metagenome]